MSEDRGEKTSIGLKSAMISVYVIIGFLVAVYCWIFGDTAHKSFAYNLGMGVVWPAVIFPAFGKFVGGVVLVLFIVVATALS